MMGRLMKILICFILSIIPILHTGYLTTIAETTKVSINVPILNVREGPGLSFNVKAKAKEGEHYTILDQQQDWLKLQLQNGDTGWVASWYTTPINENPAKETETGEVTVNILNFRSKPTIESKIIGKLKGGTKVAILSNQNDWVEIQYKGTQGWVAKEYLKISKPNVNAPVESPKKPDEVKYEIGTITASVLNVRDEGSLNGKVITQVSKGASVEILEEKEKWYRIILSNQKEGWVAGWFVSKEDIQENENTTETDDQDESNEYITVLNDGTNIRTGPSTSDQIIMRANDGNTYPIISLEGDWFKIKLPNNQIGYVAGWIVKSSNQSTVVEHDGIESYLHDKTIVIDPGHGGRDSGTIGANGTLEKNLTMKTANLVYDKLKATGANVILTRRNDNYISLQNRVSTSHYHSADAFISIHYNSSLIPFVRGTSTYYYYSKNKQLAQDIQSQIIRNTGFIDRRINFGNYQVIRENKQPSVLIEFGFLSNSAEELTIRTNSYQEKAANSVYYGLAQYFKE